jgi:hypothetical protein
MVSDRVKMARSTYKFSRPDTITQGTNRGFHLFQRVQEQILKLGLAIDFIKDERKVLCQVSYSNVPQSIGCCRFDFFRWRLEGPDHHYFYVGMST